MKRLLIYLTAIMLFPQLISAVILVHKPEQSFSVSQTCVVTHKTCKKPSCTAPHIWVAYNAHKQTGSQVLNRSLRRQKPAERARYLARGNASQRTNNRLAQAQ